MYMSDYKQMNLYVPLSAQDILERLKGHAPFSRFKNDNGLAYFPDFRMEQPALLVCQDLDEVYVHHLIQQEPYAQMLTSFGFTPQSQLSSFEGDYFKRQTRRDALFTALEKEDISYVVMASSLELDALKPTFCKSSLARGYSASTGVVPFVF